MSRYSQQQMDRFCRTFLLTRDPDAAAKAAGVKDPVALLQQPRCQQTMQRTRQAFDEQLQRTDVLRHAARLAFARPNDCVRLALSPETPVDGLDLSLLSELKRSDRGAVEVKLIDRTALLQFLYQNAQAERNGFDELFRAMADPAGAGERQEAGLV